MSGVVCPSCQEPAVGMAQVGGTRDVTIGEDADVLCYDCGATYVITATVFGWVSREATPEDREAAARRPLFNHVRTEYAAHREAGGTT